MSLNRNIAVVNKSIPIDLLCYAVLVLRLLSMRATTLMNTFQPVSYYLPPLLHTIDLNWLTVILLSSMIAFNQSE
jgi:hypothetical protein